MHESNRVDTNSLLHSSINQAHMIPSDHWTRSSLNRRSSRTLVYLRTHNLNRTTAQVISLLTRKLKEVHTNHSSTKVDLRQHNKIDQLSSKIVPREEDMDPA